MANKDRMRPPCFRKIRKAFSQYSWNILNSREFFWPLLMTCTKSCVNTNGTRSLLKPNFSLKCPRIWPKSIWNSWPVFFTMILSECLSATPRTYVATQYPAQDNVNSFIAFFNAISVVLWSFSHAGMHKLKGFNLLQLMLFEKRCIFKKIHFNSVTYYIPNF